MALHVERAETVHEVHLRYHLRSFGHCAGPQCDAQYRSRMMFFLHMMPQHSAFIQCIHDRPNISLYISTFLITYRFH